MDDVARSGSSGAAEEPAHERPAAERPEDRRARPGRGVARDDVSDASLRALCRALLPQEVERCVLLARVADARHYRVLGYASLAEYGRMLGLRPCETWDRTRTGWLLARRPDLQPEVRSGALSIPVAAALFEVISLLDEDEAAWTTDARAMAPAVFIAKVEEHLAARRIGAPPLRLTMLVSPRGKEVFDRARLLAEREVCHALGEGEALEAISEDFVERHDPDSRREARRSPPPPKQPKGRYIPLPVRRAVRQRDHNRCRAPGCQRRNPLHYAHIVPFRHGGLPTRENIILLCSVHNQMMDSGLLRITGTASDAQFLDARGRPYVDRNVGEAGGTCSGPGPPLPGA